MASYKVNFTRSAEKDLRKINKSFVSKIIERIDSLATEPRPAGVRKLVGAEQSFRIRIGDYRVIYSIHDEIRVVAIIRVRHRKDVYQ